MGIKKIGSKHSRLLPVFNLFFITILNSFKMKKLITFSLCSIICFLYNALPMVAQCNIPTITSNGQSNFGETTMGQTFTPSCTGSLSAISFIGRAGANGQSATVNIRSSNGGTACNGTILATKAITMVGQSSPGLSNSVTFTTPVPVTASTVYFIEIVSAGAYAIDISSGSDRYTGGRNYYTKTGTTCGLSTINIDMVFTATIGVTLPIELTQFDANTEGSKNNLTWTTASETNNKHFDIERSTDGTTFHNIGQVKGNNKPSSYQFVDNQPFATTYYRLRQIDFDGTETYSKIVSVVQTGKGRGLKIYPTLVSNVLTVDYTEGSLFQVINLLGQQVLVGKTTQQLDVSALPQGTYVLKVGTEVAKFVKQ
jgi:Domain of unknown function (DUF4082)/Secretion system C-terminal sorting domain